MVSLLSRSYTEALFDKTIQDSASTVMTDKNPALPSFSLLFKPTGTHPLIDSLFFFFCFFFNVQYSWQIAKL